MQAWVEIILAAKFFAALRCMDCADQRMADKFVGSAAAAEKSFLKGKNAKCLREAATHYAHPPRPPGPELRADVVDVADAKRSKLAGQPKMKTWKIGEDREWRFAAPCFRNETAHGAD